MNKKTVTAMPKMAPAELSAFVDIETNAISANKPNAAVTNDIGATDAHFTSCISRLSKEYMISLFFFFDISVGHQLVG